MKNFSFFNWHFQWVPVHPILVWMMDHVLLMLTLKLHVLVMENGAVSIVQVSLLYFLVKLIFIFRIFIRWLSVRMIEELTSSIYWKCKLNWSYDLMSNMIDFFYLKQCWHLISFVVSPCDNNPCENNGTCSVDVNGNATCTCDGNWNGTYCQGNHILYYQLAMYLLIFWKKMLHVYIVFNYEWALYKVYM